MTALGLSEGDVIEIVGKRSTPARAVLPYAEDEGLEIVRIDGRVNVPGDYPLEPSVYIECRKPG